MAQEGLGGVGHLGRRGRTVARVLGQHAHDEGPDCFRNAVRQRRRLFVDLLQRDRDLGLTGEGPLADEGLIADDAEGVDIGGTGRVLACGLLRGEVLHSAHDLPCGSQRDLVREPGNAEIRDLHAPGRGDEQVSRLHVAVHEPLVVGDLQGAPGLGEDREGLLPRHGLVPLEQHGQRLARHELHDEITRPGLLAVVVDIGDAGVLEQGGMPCLGAEATQERLVPGVLLLQDLDRDSAAKDLIGSLPDFPHSTDGDAFGQLVPIAHQNADSRSHSSTTASRSSFSWGVVSDDPVS